VDHLARGSMKNAANCASTCELQDTWTSTFRTHIAVHGRPVLGPLLTEGRFNFKDCQARLSIYARMDSVIISVEITIPSARSAAASRRVGRLSRLSIRSARDEIVDASSWIAIAELMTRCRARVVLTPKGTRMSCPRNKIFIIGRRLQIRSPYGGWNFTNAFAHSTRINIRKRERERERDRISC